LTGEKMQVAARKRSVLNWVVLGALLLAAAMVYALIPLLYFYPPSAIWSFITFQHDARLAPSLHWIYMVCVAVMLLDIAVIRHLMCKYMCIYRVWLHSFKPRLTLRIAYAASRSDHCRTCNYCVDACFLDIDPRRTDVFDSCVNCGECIRACDELHAKSRKLEGPGLLRFAFGREDEGRLKGTALGSFVARARGAIAFTLLGGAMFVIGILGYQPADFTVYRSEAWQGEKVLDYRVNIAWKLYRPADMEIRVDGLPEGAFRLARRRAHFDTAGRLDVPLHIDAGLPQGVHRFTVTVRAGQEWEKSFGVVHYAPGEGKERTHG
ncbi:MAG: 4Fe-4S dicluster domain-containing protein, partial [Mariprofundaceae bacterium]